MFSPTGKHLHDIKGDWSVVHSLALFEPEVRNNKRKERIAIIFVSKDVLCVADREGKKIDCVGAGLRFPQFLGQVSSSIPGIGRVFGLAGRGSALLAVTGKGSVYDPPVRVSIIISFL